MLDVFTSSRVQVRERLGGLVRDPEAERQRDARRRAAAVVTPAGAVESALSAVRAFNEQPLATRSAYYSASTAGSAAYTTVPILPPTAKQAANAPLLPWRDMLVLHFGHGESHLDHLPAECLDALLEYHGALTALGKVIAGLLSEALGVGAEQLDRAVQVQPTLMQCHYYPPCPQPERIVGSRVHTDGPGSQDSEVSSSDIYLCFESCSSN